MRLPYVVRRFGARLVRRIPLTIPSGPLEGLRWSLASAGRGYARGTFDPGRVEVLEALLRPGECVWDVGAHKGYMSLVAARRVGPEGVVYAFEPSRQNLWFLRRHVAWSGLDRVDVRPVAISDFDGRAAFGGRGSTVTLRLGQGEERVEVRRIDSLVSEEGMSPPGFLKVDVEGEEGRVLEGAGAVLPPDGAVMVSVHSREEHRRCAALLERSGYRLHPSGELAAMTASEAREWEGDPDLLAVGPERNVPAGVLEGLRLVG